MRALRLKLRDELWKCFPRADAISIGKAVNAILPLMLRESFSLVDMEHKEDCACWNCVHALHNAVSERVARWRVAQETAEDYD
jgi:hypothetical protein